MIDSLRISRALVSLSFFFLFFVLFYDQLQIGASIYLKGYSAALDSIQLSRCLEQEMWEDSKEILRQIGLNRFDFLRVKDIPKMELEKSMQLTS